MTGKTAGLPEPGFDPKAAELFELMVAPVRSWVLLTGLELEIFEHLESPCSARELAGRMGLHPLNTRIFLDAATAGDFLRKEDENYQNLAFVNQYLLRKSPVFLGGMLYNSRYYWLDGLDQMAEQIKKGPLPAQEPKVTEDAMWQTMCQGLAASQRMMITSLAIEAARQVPGHENFQKILDLGGGPGLVGMALVKEFKQAKGVLFDQPGVVREAGKYIKSEGLEARFNTMGGDFTSDDLGRDYDLIWASSCLYFARHDLKAMMKRILEALKPGGVFINLHEGMEKQGTSPSAAVLSMLLTSLRGEPDMMFQKGELARAMAEVGFDPIQTRQVKTPWSVFELELAFKPEA